MKKVLIIGIDSFTGTYLKSYLEKYDFDVYGTAYSYNSDRIYRCDISKKNEIKDILNSIKPMYIINLAAISFVGNSNKEIFYQVNVLAVENILDSLLEIENYIPKKTILVSSATVYGNQDENILDESMSPNPVNHYGISKLAMEQISKNYFGKLDIIITRPFNYTGVGQGEHFLIPKIVKHFKEKKDVIELGNLDVSREFNDVEFVCEVYKKLLECDYNSTIVNVCSGRGIKLLDVIDIMNNISDYKIEIKVNSSFVRKDEIKCLTGSSKKLFEMIGYVQQKEFKDTLKNMYKDK